MSLPLFSFAESNVDLLTFRQTYFTKYRSFLDLRMPVSVWSGLEERPECNEFQLTIATTIGKDRKQTIHTNLSPPLQRAEALRWHPPWALLLELRLNELTVGCEVR